MSEATLERGLNALREQIDTPIALFFSSCTHCGMCATACLVRAVSCCFKAHITLVTIMRCLRVRQRLCSLMGLELAR